MHTIRILGLDPGLARMGWGAIDVNGARLVHVGHGVLVSDARAELGARLMVLHAQLAAVIAELRPALTETVEGIRSDIIGLAAPKRRSGAGA